MNIFYVFFAGDEWKISADHFDIKSGFLIFFQNSIPIAAFNEGSWDAVKLFDESE
jgi:hypothetical protein